MAAHTAVAGLGFPMVIGLVLIVICWNTVAAGISYVNFPGHKIAAKSSIIDVVNAKSAEDCIVYCVTTPGCHSVSVLNASNVCQMNNSSMTTPDEYWDTWSPKQAVPDKTTTSKTIKGNPELCQQLILHNQI
jgi:hypothetical protein